jgi:hypothetical protein
MNLSSVFRLCILGFVFSGLASGQAGTKGQTVVKREHAQAKPTPSPQELANRLSLSVVIVETLDHPFGDVSVVGRDSGVVVLPNQVVTNRHVVDAGQGWRIKQGEKTWRAIVASIDPDHDLALLKVADEDLVVLKVGGLDATPVSLRFSPTLMAGEHVLAIGSSDGRELSVSEGLVSGFRDYQLGRLIQTSAPLYVSSSGGGLFDVQGRLVGITSYSLQEGHNLNFALPAEWVQALVHPQTSTSPQQSIGESKAFLNAGTALYNFETMVYGRRIFHNRPSKPESARAVSWLYFASHFECIRHKNSPECFDNWPLWQRASLLMLDLREEIKRAQPATDELDATFIESARSDWSALSDIYCAEKPGGSYTDLEGKIRACPGSH